MTFTDAINDCGNYVSVKMSSMVCEIIWW